MGHKKPKISNEPQNIISPANIKNINTQLVISFEYLDTGSKKYSMNAIGDNKTTIKFYNDFFNKLKEYEKLDNFKKYVHDNLVFRVKNHIHPIDWKDNKIRESGFNCLDSRLMEQIREECWQLGINNHGFRIHGFFIENVFYVVWLDPNHELYERK